MYCARLDHFAKVDQRGVRRCCHMTDPPMFTNVVDLENSEWLVSVKEQFARDEWPDVCIKCEQLEKAGMRSMRESTREPYHNKFREIKDDYLIVNLSLNNTCNAACAVCGPRSSSTKSKMYGLPVSMFDGRVELEKIQKDRILQLNMAGGEPSVDPITRAFVKNIPKDPSFVNLARMEVHSNGSREMSEIIPMLDTGVDIGVTLSMDGTESVFEYCRFPLSWSKFRKSIDYYQELSEKYSNLRFILWSTFSALSIVDLPNMIKFSESVNVPFLGAVVSHHDWLKLSNKNFLTVLAKEKILQSGVEKALEYIPLLATDEIDTSAEFIEAIKFMDSKRNSSFNDYYTHLNLRIS